MSDSSSIERFYSCLGIPLLATDYDGLTDLVVDKARQRARLGIDFANTHVLTMRRENPEFRRIAKMDYLLPDGMPLVWCMNRSGATLKDRVYGPTFTRRFLSGCPDDLTHYFVGGSRECGDAMIRVLQRANPGLRVVGRFHGTCTAEGILGAEDRAILEEIRTLRPHCIWVGLGTPKQYAWIHRTAPLLDSGIFLAVGFAFDAIAGTKSDAPMWMQKLGLTWLYRMASEPRRLIPRYLKYNSLFLYYCAADAWGALCAICRRHPARGG